MKKEDAKALAANIQEQRPSGRQAVATAIEDSEFWPKDTWWVMIYTAQGLIEFHVEDVNNPRLGMIGVA